MQFTTVAATPVVSVSPAYSAGDQVGTLMPLTGAAQASGDGALLRQISIVDSAKQKAALTVYFFEALPTIASVDNAAFDVTDAQMAANCIGSVTVAASDYADTASNSVATKQVTMPVKAKGSSTIYAVCATTGTPTYATTSDLVLRFHFTWE